MGPAGAITEPGSADQETGAVISPHLATSRGGQLTADTSWADKEPDDFYPVSPDSFRDHPGNTWVHTWLIDCEIGFWNQQTLAKYFLFLAWYLRWCNSASEVFGQYLPYPINGSRSVNMFRSSMVFLINQIRVNEKLNSINCYHGLSFIDWHWFYLFVF